MDTKNRIGILIGVLVVFLVTLAVGVGIKTFLSNRTESESQENLPESEPALSAAKEKAKPSKGVAFTRWLITEAVEAKAEEEQEGAPLEEELESADVEEEEATEGKESEENASEDSVSLIADQGQTDSGERTWTGETPTRGRTGRTGKMVIPSLVEQYNVQLHPRPLRIA